MAIPSQPLLKPSTPPVEILHRNGLELLWRPVTPDDTPDIIALIAGIFKDYGFEIDLPEEDRDLLEVQGQYGQPGCGFYGLFHSATGVLVGTCGYLRRFPQDSTAPVAELMRFYIHPQYRGHGLGQWMLDAIKDQCRGWGYKTMVLESHSRLGHALDLYRRNGFQDVSREAFPTETLQSCNVFMVGPL